MSQAGQQEVRAGGEGQAIRAARRAIELVSGRSRWIEALAAVAARGHAHLPLLAPDDCRLLLESCESLPYRIARPLVGPEGRRVRQDFELTMEIPEAHAIRDLAGALEEAVTGASRAMAANPLPEGILFNDLIVQRYPKGSLGITPHRDHLRYTGLVVLVTLVGSARFFVCADRGGSDPVEIPAPPGGAILLAAPGFAGGKERPFHYLDSVTEPRVSLGIRHDTRPGEPT